ncbi:phosphoethanolamine transferase [Campylobacterota bacterium]|nr:phosphoethanolamine transferase [Campylobacterota bacterium]
MNYTVDYTGLDVAHSRFGWRLSDRTAIVILAIYFTIVFNLTLWSYLLENFDISGAATFFAILSFPIIVFCVKCIIFSVVVLPYIFKPLTILLLLISACVNYFSVKYGVIIDADMVRNTVETNVGEAFDLITPSLAVWFVISGVLPSLIVARVTIVYPSAKKVALQRIIYLFSAIVLALVLAGVNYKTYSFFGRNHGQIRRFVVPENYLYAVPRYFYLTAQANRPFVNIDKEAEFKPYIDEEKTVIVLVLGETARSDHFSLNGYDRPTNPLLERQADLISFKNVISAGTATAISVPAIFSHRPKEGFSADEAKYSENVLDLIKQIGWNIIWLENDGGCKKVCDRVDSIVFDPKANDKLCDGDYCYDEIMLEDIETRFSNIENHTFMVLHTIGSHGPTYYRRYPEQFKQFTPTCDTAELQNCDSANIVNTYDNTILYTDYIVNSVIETAQKFPQYETTVIYVSDHGESLGENGIYLHGLPYSIAPKWQKHVPLLFWMNDNAKRNDHIDYECLRKSADRDLSHDNMFHTLVALTEFDTTLYDEKLDFLANCRTEPLPR